MPTPVEHRIRSEDRMGDERSGDPSGEDSLDPRAELANFRAQLKALDERTKERDPSLLSALRTLVDDAVRWQRGERDFPKAAALGVLFAYLRPRLILSIVGVTGLFIAGLQIWLLVQQNKLIANQNELLTSQTRSNQLAMLKDVFSELTAENGESSDLFLAGLRAYGDQAFGALLVVASESSNHAIRERAFRAILEGADTHGSAEIGQTLQLIHRYGTGVTTRYAIAQEVTPEIEAEMVRREERLPQMRFDAIQAFIDYSWKINAKHMNNLTNDSYNAILMIDSIVKSGVGGRDAVYLDEMSSIKYNTARSMWCKHALPSITTGLDPLPSVASWHRYCEKS
jgi:hypothetical protein